MAYYVGDTWSDFLLLLDTAGDPITGATLTVEVSADPSGDAFSPDIEELGDGAYQVSFDLDEAGTWFCQLLYDGTPDQRFPFSVDVDTAPSTGVVSTISVVGTSLATLRRDVADRVMDLIELTATSGSTTTFADQDALLDSDHAFRGAEILITSGSNDGARRRVYDSDEETQTLTLSRALSFAISAGITAELYNLKSVGFRVDAYDRAINRAIRDAFPNNAVVIEDELDDPFDADVGTVEIPAAFTHVSQVWYQDTSTDKWYEIPVALAGVMDGPGWSVRAGSQEIHVGCPDDATADGFPIKLVGYGRPADLSADGDLTQTDPQWIVAYAAYQLLASRGRKDPEVYALMGMLRNESDVALAKMAARPRLNNTIRVR